MQPLQNQIALVTGASRGIGQAIALELAKQGATVAGTATTAEGAEKISALFAQHKLSGKGFALNVTDQQGIERALESIKQLLGAPTILINNAGITRDNLMLRMKDEEWTEVINTNLTAVYKMTKACIRDMIKARFGRIINIGSVVGTMGNPGQVNYAAAKAGLMGFTKSLAIELASRGITVNVIAPGYIETDMTKILSDDQKNLLLNRIPVDRLGQPADIAYTCVFLASPQASYITGQTLHVDGGMCMS